MNYLNAPVPVCQWDQLPSSLSGSVKEETGYPPSSLDRFLKDVEYARGHPQFPIDFVPLNPAGPAGGSFLEFLQSKQDNPWAKRLLSLAASPPQSPLSLGKKITFAEQDCRFYDFIRNEVTIPWLACEAGDLNSSEAALRRWIRRILAEFREGSSDLAPQCDFSRKLRESERLFRAMQLPSAEGGLGLDFDWDQEEAHRELETIYRDRKATCAEFVILFLFAAQEIGISADPILALPRDGGIEQEHLLIGFRDPATGKIAAVADHWKDFFGNLDESSKIFFPLSRSDFLIYYFNLKGAREADLERAEAWIDRALSVEPAHYLSLFNKAFFHINRGEFSAGKELLLRSIKDFPRLTNAYYNLGMSAERLKEDPLANWAWHHYRRLDFRSEPPSESLSSPVTPQL